MEKLEIIGGKKLQGSINISGSKNASLPILAATILANKVTLNNVPQVKDIDTMTELLTSLGSKIYINKNQFFERIRELVWSATIGGYQPCQKWLKDRKGRQLDFRN